MPEQDAKQWTTAIAKMKFHTHRSNLLVNLEDICEKKLGKIDPHVVALFPIHRSVIPQNLWTEVTVNNVNHEMSGTTNKPRVMGLIQSGFK